MLAAKRQERKCSEMRPHRERTRTRPLIGDVLSGRMLRETVRGLDLRVLDAEQAEYVSPAALKRVASFGLRGEVFFPVPCILQANPFLLGYYRLLLGLSQKELYNKSGLGRFKRLEDQGDITDALRREVPELCKCLVAASEKLVDGIDRLSLDIVHELQLLTIGPQFRGSENTRLGQGATKEFFELVHDVVTPYLKDVTGRTMLIENDSGRPVLIEFASDPDVRITQTLESQARPLVSIEVKGGTDASNIHNRLGEAEKSHQKARNRGFFEFWTVLRCDVDLAMAGRESPTTSHFFHLDHIKDESSDQHRQFKELLGSLLGIQT